MPATLAALSCALALLAANPVGTEETRTGSGSGVMVRIGGESRTILSTSAATVGSETEKSPRRVSTSEFTPRQIHILATVEMLRRFFAFDLQNSERLTDGLPSLFAPTALCEFELVHIPANTEIETQILPQARESAFLCQTTHLPPPARS